VTDAQITATQGKGLERVDALASALMEAVERYSAGRPRARRVATVEELRAAGEPHCSPERLGATPFGASPIEWVRSASLRTGEPTWIPAAEVLFPYFAPPGVTVPVRPSTTGLAAGNTLLEAVLHAVCEVVERDAVSRYRAGAPAPLVDLTSVGAGPERDLVERYAAVGIRLFVADLSRLAPIPVYFAHTYSDDGVTPAIGAGGQGAGFSAPDAFRRALLEAAQSRVVAIQGSREDLIRHASVWGDTSVEVRQHWERTRSRAAERGAVPLPPMVEPPRSVSHAVERVLGHLAANDYHELFVTDLTDPEIGVPVVHVAIPGLTDTVVDPSRRRRVA
jgi:ribosomal protein S12 methylthiotransferase accessory factor